MIAPERFRHWPLARLEALIRVASLLCVLIIIGATLSHLHRDGFLSRQRKGLGYRYFIAEPAAEPAAEPVAPQPLSDYERARFERMKIDLPDAETKLRANGHKFAQPSQALLDNIRKVRTAMLAELHKDGAAFGVKDHNAMVGYYEQQYKALAK